MTCFRLYYDVRTQHAKHAETRGVWGHAPPGIFLKIYTKRLNLVEFQSIKITSKLKTSCMDDIWKNASIAAVIIPSAHVCV